MRVGDRVQVKSECQTFGHIGTVNSFFHSGNNYCAVVVLDNRKIRSYNVKSLNVIISRVEGEEDIMDKPKFLDGKYIVKVKGNYSKGYCYICRDENVMVGDKVVCEDESYIQTVIGIYDEENSPYKNVTKEVICVIDYTKFNERKEKEKAIAKAKLELENRIRQIQKQFDYEAYAEKDESVAELLKIYKDLQK